VADPGHVLVDDRPGVEISGDVVGGGADQLHPALVGAPVGIGADEGRQEGVVDVDRRGAELLQEAGGEDLHVAGEDEQVDAADQLQRPPLRRLAGAGLDRHVVKGDVNRGDLLGMVGVVGDDPDQLAAELAVAPAPEQVGEAVVLARDHDRDPLALARRREAVLHLERRGHLRREAQLQLPALRGRRRVEDHPHEEAALAGRVLVDVDDVEPGIGEESTDRRDQSRPVGAGEEQA
jgi:hypothetical protein